MGIEEKLPSGILLTSVEKLVNWSRKSSFWPATFGPRFATVLMKPPEL